MNTYFSANELLSPPVERAAFSDRIAYVCAELSKLAYFKFEGGHTADDLVSFAKSLFKDDERVTLLENRIKALLTASASSEQESKNALSEILKHANFELVKTFSIKGTQAFICTRKIRSSSQGNDKVVAFLVFRGTEPTDFADIKTDVKANLVDVEIGGMTIQMHSGYVEAFDWVREDVNSALDNLPHDQLIITGHSLGGALAIVATRLLASDVVGACYTFGAPPVGTVEVSNNLKTPVYEIINEIDIVPRLPNPWMASAVLALIRLIRWIGKVFTFVGKILASSTWDDKLQEWMDMMVKFRHPGYLSYLVGSGAAARLRYNVSPFDRLKWWLTMIFKSKAMLAKKGFRKMAGDHSIDLYIKKLIVHAQRRQ
ncbi:MAG: lipase family protein [Gammaproteobacteria bacterium]|nr:lipase family protein [Gammaproteobacteria bacterium]